MNELKPFQSYSMKAFKTKRKLPLFGYNPGGEPDFEWPTQQDIEKMPQDSKPIKVVAIEWQKSTVNSNYIGGLRLVLSNGNKSPSFFAHG